MRQERDFDARRARLPINLAPVGTMAYQTISI
jgi:hypothetical protein